MYLCAILAELVDRKEQTSGGTANDVEMAFVTYGKIGFNLNLKQ